MDEKNIKDKKNFKYKVTNIIREYYYPIKGNFDGYIYSSIYSIDRFNAILYDKSLNKLQINEVFCGKVVYLSRNEIHLMTLYDYRKTNKGKIIWRKFAPYKLEIQFKNRDID